MQNDFDVAVIGLGAMGSACLSQLAARGARVIGFEAAYPAHSRGSSHGDSRLIRLGYFEDPSYVPLLERAYRNWRQLEAQLRADILTITGVLQIGKPDSKIVSGTLASCREYGLAHDLISPADTALRFPAFTLQPDEVAVLDPQGGYLRPEDAINGYLKLAGEDGAVMHIGEKIVAIEPDDQGVNLISTHGRCRAAKVVVATGPWISELVPELKAIAQPIRQVVSWYQPLDGFRTLPGRMASFLLDEDDDGSFFGFPAIGRDGVKVGRHCHFREPIDPDGVDQLPNAADAALLDGFVARRLGGAVGARVRSTTCRYTMLPSEDFLIDFLPSDARIIVASPCSGHGFKFTSVVGEMLCEMALDGDTQLPRHAFSFEALRRFMHRA